MKLFLNILKEHKKTFIYLVVCFVCYIVVLFLYDERVEPVFYATFLCLLIGLIILVIELARQKRRIGTLHAVEERILLELSEMPEPQSAIEEEYQRIIHTLSDARNSAAGEYDLKTAEMTDYYTLWTHQIKTPIAAMRLLLQSEDSERSRELSAELFRIEQYVEMALGFMRLDGNVNDFVIQNCRLDDIVRQAVRKYSKQFIRKKIALDFKESGSIVLSDEKWLCFVIEQILSNSLKYTESGTISIYCSQNHTLVIEDTGIGIAPEDLPRVCERGYTGYNGRLDKKSTGIGLYLCRRITRKLGHTLIIESQPGKGTRVKIGLESIELKVE